jgi:hypothetical protein
MTHAHWKILENSAPQFPERNDEEKTYETNGYAPTPAIRLGAASLILKNTKNEKTD